MPPTRPRKKKAGPNDVVMQMGDGTERIIKNGLLPMEAEETNRDKINKFRIQPQFQKDVTKELNTLLARDESKKVFDEYKMSQEKVPDFSVFSETFFDELKTEPPEQIYSVEMIAKIGQVISMPSPRKTGKTTLLANLGFAGLTGSDFLGRFATDLGPDESLAVINAEMLRYDNREPWENVGKGESPDDRPDPYKRLHFIHCRETGVKINLLNNRTREGLAEWLIDRNAKWLFLDPWKEFVHWAHADPNKDPDVEAVCEAIRDLGRLAGLSLTVIPAHTPQSGEAGIRAKGAGAFEDGVDGMWAYYKVGKNKNRSSARVFGAEGRFTGIDPTEVMFDSVNHSLSFGSRSASEITAEERREQKEIESMGKPMVTGDAIYEILDHPMTPAEIAGKLDITPKAASMSLGRGKKTGRFVQVGDGTWSRVLWETYRNSGRMRKNAANTAGL